MKSRLRLKLSLAPLVLTLGVVPAVAHQLDLVRATVGAEETGRYRVVFDLPPSLPSSSATGAPDWPEGCSAEKLAEQISHDGWQQIYRMSCAGPLDESAYIAIPWGRDGAYLATSDGRAAPVFVGGSAGGARLPVGAVAAGPRDLLTVAGDYLLLGMGHILLGWDHLTFVLCLCLLAGGWSLVLLVTGFTIGHSLSLALAYLGLITVPIPPVEAVIALSIAFIVREALLAHGSTRGASRRQVALVAGFGLLHGLGFASALGEIGVSAGERLVGLLFFNIGVECGQLAFVALVMAAMALAARLAISQPMRAALLYGAGCLGAFWFIERIAGFAV